jgi:phosphoesterase RecJ-like protein
MTTGTLRDEKLVQEIRGRIEKAQRILLHCHPNTDGDSVGSVLAVYHALRREGKEITIIAGDNSPMPTYLSFMPGYKEIVSHDFFQTSVANFDLFLILDAGSPNQISKKAPISFPLTIPTVTIDHHASNAGFADINLIDPTRPATCQILYELFKKWGMEIDHDTALCLLVGIFTDTGGFKYKGTSADTFSAAADLAKIVPEFTDYFFALQNSNDPGRMAFIGIALSNIQVLGNGHVAISIISRGDIEKRGISLDDLGGAGGFVSTLLQSVIGWEIGIVCTEQMPGQIKLSFRSRDPKSFDVSKIAVVLGGGGHPAAAGAALSGTLDQVLPKIQKALDQTYPQLAKAVK